MPGQDNDPFEEFTLASNDLPSLDPALRNIYALFGQNTTLIPIPNGTEAHSSPRLTSLAISLEAAHQAELRKANVAVQFGKESGNLCGIEFGLQDHYELFLEKNPRLRSTLITEADGVLLVFVRLVDVALPSSVVSAAGKWLYEGSVAPLYCRGNPGAIRIISPHTPIALAFSDIFWPVEMRIAFARMEVAKLYGPPLRKDKKDVWVLNEMYWAQFFSTVTSVSYRPNARQFVKRQDGALRPAADAVIERDLLEFITKWRPDSPASPISAVDVARCLKTLQIVAADANEPGAGVDHINTFLNEQIEACPGHDITSEELYHCYRDWTQKSDVLPLVELQFLRTLPERIARAFGVKSLRDPVWQRETRLFRPANQRHCLSSGRLGRLGRV